MKALMINGSPHPNGCTARALKEVADTLEAQGVESQIINVGNKDIRGCIGCGYCREHGQCVFKDLVNETAPLFEEADGVIVGTPVYYAHANGGVISFLDRLFYSTPFFKSYESRCNSCEVNPKVCTIDFRVHFITLGRHCAICSGPKGHPIFIHGAGQRGLAQNHLSCNRAVDKEDRCP